MFNCNSSDIGIVRALLQGIILGYYRSVEGFIQVIFNGLVLKDHFQQTKRGRLPRTLGCVPLHYHIVHLLRPKRCKFHDSLIKPLWAHCTSGRFTFFNSVPMQ